MEQYILTIIVQMGTTHIWNHILYWVMVFTEDESGSNSIRPDGTGSNGEVERLGKRLVDVAAQGKSWQEY